MKALQIHGPNDASLVDVPDPEPGPGEVLVRVEAVTTCPQWDLHIMGGEPMFLGAELTFPYTAGQPGHEAVGRVVEVGEGVAAPAVGQRVAVWRDPGHDKLGCYAELVSRPVEDVLAVPDDLRPESVSALELAMCVRVSFERLERFDAVRGARFGVSGLGPAGLVAVQMARAAGAKEIVGVDPEEERRAAALELGATEVHHPSDFPATYPGQEAALDSSIECAGAPQSLRFLMDRTRDSVALFGVVRDEVPFSPRHGRLSVLGYRYHHRGAAEDALQLILDQQLDLAPLVSETLPLGEYAVGVEKLRTREAMKICYIP